MSEALPFTHLTEPEEILKACWEQFGPSATLSTSLQGAGLAAIHIAASRGWKFPVFLIDTGLHFPETLEFLEVIEKLLGISIHRITPALSVARQAEEYGEALWERSPDQCCHLRKVLPLQRHLSGFKAWITGIRKGQTSHRDRQSPFEVVELHALPEPLSIYKISPFLLWDREEVHAYLDSHGVPRHPLLSRGYQSIGCSYCTVPVGTNDDERSGRWKGLKKTECGIHTIPSRPLTSEPTSPELL